MAKELAMAERNAKGKLARQYFIECERRALAVVPAPAPAVLSPAEMFLQNAQIMVAIESRAAEMEQAQSRYLSASILVNMHRLGSRPGLLFNVDQALAHTDLLRILQRDIRVAEALKRPTKSAAVSAAAAQPLRATER